MNPKRSSLLSKRTSALIDHRLRCRQTASIVSQVRRSGKHSFTNFQHDDKHRRRSSGIYGISASSSLDTRTGRNVPTWLWPRWTTKKSGTYSTALDQPRPLRRKWARRNETTPPAPKSSNQVSTAACTGIWFGSTTATRFVTPWRGFRHRLGKEWCTRFSNKSSTSILKRTNSTATASGQTRFLRR